MLVYNNILEGYKAREMAEEYNVSEPQAAKEYFEETFEYDDFNEENIKNKKFICNIHNINCDMYYDYGSDYYFLVKENEPMKQQLSLNEKTLKKIIKESVKRVLNEIGNNVNYQYILHAFTPGIGNDTLPLKTIQDAKPYIEKAAYWDINKYSTSNTSDPEGLIAWGGEGGYWDNVIKLNDNPRYGKPLSQNKLNYIMSKKVNNYNELINKMRR